VFHNQPKAPADVPDDGVFRLIVLGADYAGQPGAKPHTGAEAFLRTHSSPTDNRTCQNIVLVVTPSIAGLQQAEQQIADWLAWQEIKQTKDFKDYESHVKEAVNKRERESKQVAETAVKNAYELVLHVDKTGALQVKKFTMGAQALFPTLLQEKELRLFKEKIDAETIMPGGPYAVWPRRMTASKSVPSTNSSHGDPTYRSFEPANGDEHDCRCSSARRSCLAHVRPDGSDQWFWRCKIDVTDWEKNGEAWLPNKAVLNSLSNARDPTGIVVRLVAGGTRRGGANDPLFVVRREACLPRSHPAGVSGRGPPDSASGGGRRFIRPSHKRLSLEICGWSLATKACGRMSRRRFSLMQRQRCFGGPPVLMQLSFLPGALLKDAWSAETERRPRWRNFMRN